VTKKAPTLGAPCPEWSGCQKGTYFVLIMPDVAAGLLGFVGPVEVPPDPPALLLPNPAFGLTPDVAPGVAVGDPIGPPFGAGTAVGAPVAAPPTPCCPKAALPVPAINKAVNTMR
jgi:hypothetical protein